MVRETGEPIAQVAGDLGLTRGTVGNWVNADRRRRGEGMGALGEDERVDWRGGTVTSSSSSHTAARPAVT
jgi:transposase-like protein